MAGGDRRQERERMIENQLISRGISDERVLEAFLEVPRHFFVPAAHRRQAYADRPLPIGKNQTISQPYIVAQMIEELRLDKEDVVLEVGVGSGYAAAILSQIVKKVYGIELYEELIEEAEKRFDDLEYNNIELKQGDGTLGWEEKSPFDGILVSAAAPHIPQSLWEQLRNEKYMVIPVGDKFVQKLMQAKKTAEGEVINRNLGMVRFVSLKGKEGWS
ncbi:MAG: protein-L-isoaspartate(D-aspartate) O-methyltransferase [Halanaerobiales bacterium]